MNVRRLPTKYEANINSWTTTKIRADYLTRLNRKLCAKNRKILQFINQCVAHQKNIAFLRNIKVIFKCPNRKQLIQKTVPMIDSELLQASAQMKLDLLPAMHFIAEAWRLVTLTIIKNCFVKCGFSNDHVSGNYDSAVKLSEDEEDDGHSLQHLGV
jgi:hypothetical protein